MKIRESYNQSGVDGYYSEQSDSYSNPHTAFVKECLDSIQIDGPRIIDFGCGDGLVTKHLMKNKSLTFVGIDKYMADRYSRETKFQAVSLGFDEMINGIDVQADVAICSYVIDLIPDTFIKQVMWSLSQSVERIITIRPNSHRLNCNWLHETQHIKCGKARLTEYTK